MAVNLTRGFNRVYLLAICLWAVYVLLVVPYGADRAAGKQLMNNAVAVGTACMDKANDETTRQKCLDLMEETEKKSFERYEGNPWADTFGHGYVGVLIGLGVVVIPPGLLYATIIGLAKITQWVVMGFRS